MGKIIALMVGMIVAMPMVASAQPPVSTILRQTKEASDPSRPSVRTITITVDNLGDTRRFVARQARKSMPDGKRMTTVVMEPAELRGSAVMVFEPKDPSKQTLMWEYVPFVQRVRKVISVGTYVHFFGTDFTYDDLGFSFMRSRTADRLVGTEQHNGSSAYKVETKFAAGQMFYARVVTWIDKGTMLPLEREYYDPAGQLWKREVFDSVSTIDGVPTVLHAHMTDLDAKTSSDLKVSEVTYDAGLPDSLFEPLHMPKLSDDAEWTTTGAAGK